MSHPTWVCGLKRSIRYATCPGSRSHPTWVCGLKQQGALTEKQVESHTLRGCVDWNMGVLPASQYGSVTPYVGVWIETSDVDVEYFINSHTLRGCVDWNVWCCYVWWISWCHTLRGCVDWNVIGNGSLISILCHTLRGCVDWNSQAKVCSFLSLGHTLRGCVDWNNDEVNTCIDNQSHPTWVCGLKPLLSFFLRLGKVTPYVGVWIETSMAQYSAISKMVKQQKKTDKR